MPEPTPLLFLEPESVDAMRAEFDEHLRRGGCFVADAEGVAESEPCVLVLVHPDGGATLTLPATAVWVSDSPPGVGVELNDFDDELRDAIEQFVDNPPPPVFEPASAPYAEEPTSQPSLDSLLPIESEPPVESAPPAGSLPPGESMPPVVGVSPQERLRKLNATQMTKIARAGKDPTERMLLERIYGKAVWAALLTNPRLTVPEVIRLSRMRNLPIPQLEQIVGNPSFLKSPQVRRALLTNPRLSRAMAHKVLTILPRHELKLAAQQTAYPPAVRDAATKLLGR